MYNILSCSVNKIGKMWWHNFLLLQMCGTLWSLYLYFFFSFYMNAFKDLMPTRALIFPQYPLHQYPVWAKKESILLFKLDQPQTKLKKVTLCVSFCNKWKKTPHCQKERLLLMIAILFHKKILMHNRFNITVFVSCRFLPT